MPCHCRKRTIVITSWKDDDLGRRFRAIEEVVCGYFSWFDPPMCIRAKEVIPDQLRKKNKLEDDMKKYKATYRALGVLLAISWVIMVLLIISYLIALNLILNFTN